MSTAVPVMGANPGGGGGGGTCPPTFFKVGDTISNVVPPPPPRFGGRMNFGRYNVVFAFFSRFLGLFPFFYPLFFLLVRNVRDVGWVPLHILTCATFDADGAPEKKFRSPPPPPPPHQLFLGLALPLGLAAVGKNVSVPPPPPPPHTTRFGFAPLVPVKALYCLRIQFYSGHLNQNVTCLTYRR